jgi:hypothetical protein
MPMGNSPEPPVTRSGAYKQRFTDKERFQLLDMGPADLRSFMRIFAPRESRSRLPTFLEKVNRSSLRVPLEYRGGFESRVGPQGRD